MNPMPLALSGRRLKLILLAISIGLLAGLLARTALPDAAAPAATQKPQPRKTAAKPAPLAHPLTIEAQRARSYDGRAITVEENLEGGEGYKLQRVSYVSDGHKIYALAAIPAAPAPAKGYPVIILLHGYMPPSDYVTTQGDYVDYAKKLAADGYLVFRPDLRGFGKSWGMAEGAYFSPAYATDVLNLRREIGTYPNADASRVGLFGYSMGARVALNAAVVAPKDFQGLVLVSGSVGRPETMHATWRASSDMADPVTSGTRSRVMELFGEPNEDNPFWRQVSPYSYLGDLRMPVQIHHAEDDPLVPADFSKELAAELKRIDAAPDAHFYEHGTHAFPEPLRSDVYAKVLRYYGQTLAKS